MVAQHGSFIISLDFELFWGVRDKLTLDTYGSNILNVKNAIPLMIKLFEEYEVKVTIATVGLLFCRSKKEIIEYSPFLKPSYMLKDLSPFENDYLENLSDESDPYHSAFEVIDELKGKSSVEIATHTFSHYYCWEPGQTIEEFEADIDAAKKIALDQGVQIKSIIFPRNQVSMEYLDVCMEKGIRTYRGNPDSFYSETNIFKNKIMRLVDSYIPVGKDTTYNYNQIPQDGLFNVKASRFLRPFSQRLKFLNGLKIRRILNEMTKAAKNKKVYHLWWHPHNFGNNMDQNLRSLERILKHYRMLSNRYKFESYTMSELSELLITKNMNHEY